MDEIAEGASDPGREVVGSEAVDLARYEAEFDPEAYPSLELAYPFVAKSYDLAAQRMDAAVHRIDNTLRFAATLTLAVPVAAKTVFPGLEWLTLWSFLAGVMFVLLFVVGAVATAGGGLKIIDPGELYHKWLSKSGAEFKKDLLYFAGEDFRTNYQAVNKKGYAAAGMAWLFLAELVFLGLWILA